MSESKINLNLLKDILENIDHPENLNNHPWLKSYMVAEAAYENPGLSALSPGIKLIQTISNLFPKMMPNMPPKQGIRLDNHWGEFGIIAAQYFAPFLFDHPYPASLREAWNEIDKAILLFVRTYQPDINEENLDQYRLIGDEPEIAPNSTISDWHRKGIEQFADFLERYETNLEIKTKISESQGKFHGLRRIILKIIPPRAARIWIGRVSLIIIVGLMAFGIGKGINLYRRAQSLRNQASELMGISELLENSSMPDIDEFQRISQNISDLRLGLESIQSDTSSLLKVTPYLQWLPVYGGDLSQAPLLLEMAVQISIAGDEIFQAISPILPAYIDNDDSSNILILLSQFADDCPRARQVAVIAALPRPVDVLANQFDRFLDVSVFEPSAI